MKSYEIRLREDKVDALRAYARWRAYEDGREFSWADAVRLGIDMLLSAQQTAAPVTAGGTSRRKS